jgi:hypothetical protein
MDTIIQILNSLKDNWQIIGGVIAGLAAILTAVKVIINIFKKKNQTKGRNP